MTQLKFDPSELAGSLKAPAASAGSLFGPSTERAAAPPPEMRQAVAQVLSELSCTSQTSRGPVYLEGTRERLEEKLADALEKYTKANGEALYSSREAAMADASKIFDKAAETAAKYVRENEPSFVDKLTGSGDAREKAKDAFCAPVKERAMNEQIERDSR